MVFTNYSKSQKFEDKSCLLVFEESSIGTLNISLFLGLGLGLGLGPGLGLGLGPTVCLSVH